MKYHWRVNSVSDLRLIATGADDSVAIEFGEEATELDREPGLEGGVGIESGYDNQAIIFDTILSGGTIAKYALSHKSQTTDLGIGSIYDLDAISYETRFKNHYQSPLQNGDSLGYGVEITSVDVDYDSSGLYTPCNPEFESCPPYSLGDPIDDADNFTINSNYVFSKYNWMATPLLDISFGLGISNNDYLTGTNTHPRLDARYELNLSLIHI